MACDGMWYDQSIARLDSKTTELKLRDGAKDLDGAALGTALSIGFCWATSALAALQLIPFVQFFVSIVQMVTTILCAGSIILTICALADWNQFPRGSGFGVIICLTMARKSQYSSQWLALEICNRVKILRKEIPLWVFNDDCADGVPYISILCHWSVFELLVM